jgi:hypothetical protein
MDKGEGLTAGSLGHGGCGLRKFGQKKTRTNQFFLGICDPDLPLFDSLLDWSSSYNRGATAHARNVCVDEDLIKAVQRWSKGVTGAARLDMIELYSDADALTPTYLRYSHTF